MELLRNYLQLSENLPLIGSSAPMLEVYRKLAKLMNLEETVFIFGEKWYWQNINS